MNLSLQLSKPVACLLAIGVIAYITKASGVSITSKNNKVEVGNKDNKTK